ncbi:hypothetical protein BGZ54_008338 [Gamsiella multidivaricata]|nr:hypothetical protein BGZ54_008338 [Gamsiella multidivaricata]
MSTNLTIAQTAPFAELMVSFQIISGSNQTIVCVAVLIEQKMAGVNTAISYLPLALALYSGAISFVSIILRAAVGNGFLNAMATYGLAATSELISVHTPGLFDIMFYTQFMVMTGQLSVNYPSFYVTFTSLFHWSFLEFRNSFAGNGPENSTYVLAYGGAGSANLKKGSQNAASDSSLGKRLLPIFWDDEFATTTAWQPTTTNQIKVTPIPMHTITGSRPLKRDLLPIFGTTTTAEPPTTSPQPSSATTTTTGTTTTSTTDPPSSSPTTTSSSTTTKIRPTSSATSTDAPTSTSVPTTTTTLALIIPTITDPFNNRNWNSRQHNVSDFGMEAYAAAIGASPSHIFLCTLINVVIAGGAAFFIAAFLLVVAWFVAKESRQKGKTLQHAFNFVTGNLIRIWSLFYTPLALSAMYQLTISGGTLMTSIASISLLIFSVGSIILLTRKILRASTQLLLFEDLGILLKYGPLYNTLAEEGTLFFLVNLLVRFLWGLSVAMLSAYGIAQVAVLVAVEFGYMLVIGLKWPFSDSGDNKFHLLLGFVRIVVIGCSIAYVHDLNTSPEVRQLFGYIQMALHLGVFIVMFALILWNTIQVILFWQSAHRASWKGPTKTYSFEDAVEAEHDWVLTGRPLSRRPDSATMNPMKSRRYTVEPYSSITDLRSAPEDRLINHQSTYRHTLQLPEYRRSMFPSDVNRDMALGISPDAIVPLSSSPGPISARSISPPPHSPVDSIEGPVIPLQPTQLSSARSGTQAGSYAKFQRMTHQQALPDFRSRRMSEIFRDGGYLYGPNGTAGSTSMPSEGKQNTWKSVKDSLGGLLNFGKRTATKSEDGSKPKAFEVIRPPRSPPVMDTPDDMSLAGDDNLRELNSLGISRFFQESGRNNDQKRSLFVANPEAMASQATSLRSSFSGIPHHPPHLSRTLSATTSIRTMSYRPTLAQNVSADLNSGLTGIGSSTSEHGVPESRRTSVLSAQQTYPRNSVESNIAEALRSETPLKLQGGAILKVSKGPEKAVQYWRKESGHYVGSSAEPNPERKQHVPLPVATPPLLLRSATRSPFFDSTQIDTVSNSNNTAAPSIKSRAGSRPESPTESHHSSNVAASAGRMHEILDRMFSDQDDGNSDEISEGEESCSTFSGRVSATILALHQKREQEEFDAQSLYRPDTLEPVLEHHDPDANAQQDDEVSRPGARRATSTSGKMRPGTLMRTFSGPTKSTSASTSSMILRPSKSGSLSRPLAQTPLHSPSVMPFSASTTSLLLPGALSRQPSRASLRDLTASMIKHGAVDVGVQSRNISRGTPEIVPSPENTIAQSHEPITAVLDPLHDEVPAISEPRPNNEPAPS